MASPVRIRIGASLDASVEHTFSAFERRAQMAATRAQRAMNAKAVGAKESGSATSGLTESDRMRLRSAEKLERELRSKREKEVEWARKFDEKMAANKVRASRKADREIERAFREAAADSDRVAARQIDDRNRRIQRFAGRASHRTMRTLFGYGGIASYGFRGARDFARGLGIETNLGGLTNRYVEGEKLAQAASTQAYMPGEAGPAGKRVPKGVLVSEAAGVAKETGLDRNQLLEGIKTYVNIAGGNLQTAREITPWMAKLARGQDVDFVETMRAAAKIETALLEDPKYRKDQTARSAMVKELMRGEVWSGKKGSIPFDIMAAQLPKLTGYASQYEGDVGKNVLQLSSLAQFAEMGPAQNARTATTFVRQLNSQLTKGARADAFKNVAGVNIFDETGTKLRAIKDIINETVIGTSQGYTDKSGKHFNQLQALDKVMPNIRAKGAMMKLQSTYMQAGGGEQGKQAMERLWQESGGLLSENQFMDDFALQMDTASAKVGQFNAKLDEVMAKAAPGLIKALQDATPAILQLVESLSGWIQWAAASPWKAAMLTVVLATARGVIEAGGQALIEALIRRIAIGSAAEGAAGAGAGALTGGGAAAGAGAAGGGGGFLAGAGGLAGFGAGLAAVLGVASAGAEGYSLFGNLRGGKNQIGADAFTPGKVLSWMLPNQGGAGLEAIANLAGSFGNGETWGQTLSGLLRNYNPPGSLDWTKDDPWKSREEEQQARNKEGAELLVKDTVMQQKLDLINDGLRGNLKVSISNEDSLATKIAAAVKGGGGTPKVDEGSRDKGE